MIDYAHQEQWTNGFGNQQSPIHIQTSSTAAKTGPLPVTIQSAYRLNQEIDDQTTIRLTGQGQADIFSRPFSFQQVHFHAPAEHVIDGHQTPFEIHLVHQNEIGQLVVVALLVEIGTADQPCQRIIDNYAVGKTTATQLQIDQWLPQQPAGFHYLGSLTTPPLVEGVEWLVVTNPAVTIDSSQLDWFKQHFAPNNRQPQSLAGRKVESYQ
ncbi:carbonic anhydrase [Lentilactobacillus fungorum]|uniref:carbonic anhydrase n=1 Tax=Lentilactobacillus fungorum TaxID=2201250 RepID=A0ABQ3VZ34_9LACO|nr:carbonic anhydrase family protein [Lentilactobacillus fungorum]GHP13456.1 carbonic anhydrase [Lentilactobacillus fungorum]